MIAAEAVTVEIRGNRLLDRIDLTVAAGEWVCVLGPNGAGKSTFARAVAGLVPVTGRITVDGHDVNRLKPRERSRLIALVPQHPVVPPGMTVYDYLLLGRTPHIAAFGTERADDLLATEAVTERMHLDRFRRRPLDSLSGGERQRVVLGRALVQATPVLVLDEPTTGLDIGHQQDVLELVDELRHERDLAVLSTVHDLTVAGQYADRLVMLAAGAVVADGSAADVLTEDLLHEHYGVRVRVDHDRTGITVVPVRPHRDRRLEVTR